MKRLELLRSSLEDLNNSNKTLLDGEVCLVSSSNGTGYDMIVVGDGDTEACNLPKVMLNRSGGCTFLGIAIPTTNPEKPLSDSFYVANMEGDYENFGNITLEKGEVAFLVWKYESWTKITVIEHSDFDSMFEELTEKAIFGIKIGDTELTRGEDGVLEIPVDSELNANSTNPIQNKAVCAAFEWYEGE